MRMSFCASVLDEEVSLDDYYSFVKFIKFDIELAGKANFQINVSPEAIVNSMTMLDRYQLGA